MLVAAITSWIARLDVERSAFCDAYRMGDMSVTYSRPTRIEGVGRPDVEPSFLPRVIDRMIKVSDVASLAAVPVLSEWLGHRIGGSADITGLLGPVA